MEYEHLFATESDADESHHAPIGLTNADSSQSLSDNSNSMPSTMLDEGTMDWYDRLRIRHGSERHQGVVSKFLIILQFNNFVSLLDCVS